MTEPKQIDDQMVADALSQLPTEEPPADFAARVVARRQAEHEKPARTTPPRSRSWVRWAAVGLAAAAAALVVTGKSAGPAPEVASGSLSATNRQTVRIGRRATVVAEPGTLLRWDPSADGVLAQQTQGNVFYRVEPGKPFVVRTPIGDVTVEGTSFRVEITDMKKNWQAVAGAVGGALLVVTVYEGRVLLANPIGEVRVEAGERGSAAPGQMPNKQQAPVASAVEEVAAPAPDASREDLLTRDTVQRQEIASLRARVRDLEKSALVSIPGHDSPTDPDGRPWYSPSDETLKSFVKECRVRYDSVPLLDSEPFRVGTKQASKMNLKDGERDALHRAFDGLQQSVHTRVRALYIEATGDTRGAETLSASAMENEIFDRAETSEMTDIRRRVSTERAGLAAAPTDLGKVSPVERMFRLKLALGDEAEAAVAATLGKERARQLRGANGGWSWRSEHAGCGDDEDESEQ